MINVKHYLELNCSELVRTLKNGLAVRDCKKKIILNSCPVLFFVYLPLLRAQMAMTKSVVGDAGIPVTIAGECIILSHFVQV